VDGLDVDPAIRFTGFMKATIEVPDELYRLVKAKSALEGRAVREVTVELYRHYVGQEEAPPKAEEAASGQATPSWFGALGKTARGVARHEMSAIRESIARGLVRDRDL
jgi:hypothetical protein